MTVSVGALRIMILMCSKKEANCCPCASLSSKGEKNYIADGTLTIFCEGEDPAQISANLNGVINGLV